jgi:hypothetical protein
VSEYKELPAHLAAYRKYEIGIGRTRFLGVIEPAHHGWGDELPPGRYTFQFGMVDGEPKLLRITQP